MKIAVIDMGTNTFHLLIASVENGHFTVLTRDRQPVKIGQEGLKDGWITTQAQERALKALITFKSKADESGVDKIYATGTSAIRNTENGLSLVKMIKDTTGIDVKIISGQEEATFIYYGAKKAVPMDKGTYLIMDIGGGSIEFIIVKDGEAMWMESFEIGGQRLMDKFHKHDPITSAEISELENYLDEKLGLLHEACRVFNPDTLIGSSGTFDTLSDMYRIEEGLERDPESAELPLSIQRYHLTHQQLITKTRSERLAIPGMIEMRVDMIVVASVLISYVLKRCNIHHFRGSAYALKEGVLLNILETVRQIDGAEKKKSNPNN